MATNALRGIDLADPTLYRDERPEQIWRELRSLGHPIRSGDARDYWIFTRYAHVQAVLRDTASFCSEKGMLLGADAESAARAAKAAAGKMMIVSDGTTHRALRRALGAAFTPNRVARLTDGILAITRELITEVIDAGTVDFMATVAARLPAIVISNLLGVPDSDRDYVVKLTRTAFGDIADEGLTPAEANAALFYYCDDLIARKRKTSADDVVTVLANTQLDGKPLSDEVCVLNAHGLISGGNETTRHASAVAAMFLYTQPDQWQRLRDGEVGLNTAVEEVLRISSPANHMMRCAVVDVPVAGVTVRAGEFVTVWLGSANRDEDVFEAPERVDFGREPNPHVTFGGGSHACLGAWLARLEVRCLMQAIQEQVADASPAGPPVRQESNTIRGYVSVPMSLRGRHPG